MDAVAVPVGGDVDGDVLVDADTGVAEDTGTSLGAVDEDEGGVVAVGTDNRGAVVDGDIDLQRVLERGVAILYFGEVALGDYEVFVVDGGAARDVAVDVAPVLLDENVALSYLMSAGGGGEAFADSRDECTSETTNGSEADADNLLVIGVAVTNEFFVAAHHGLAFPEEADDRADFSDESVEDSLLNFTHSCSV